VVVFAVYYPGIKDAVRQHADQLAGKVVVDITNPLDTQTWDGLVTPAGSSSAEEVAELVGKGTTVVKAFNTTFASTLVAGQVGDQRLDVLIAGDDDAARARSPSWPPTAACARWTSAPCAGPSSWSSSASSTSLCSSPSTSGSAAPSSWSAASQAGAGGV
jgi:hypothetical protein